MAALPLPAGPPLAPGGRDPLQTALYERFGIEVPVTRAAGLRLLRISAQAYNSLEQYQYLSEALGEVLE